MNDTNLILTLYNVQICCEIHQGTRSMHHLTKNHTYKTEHKSISNCCISGIYSTKDLSYQAA